MGCGELKNQGTHLMHSFWLSRPPWEAACCFTRKKKRTRAAVVSLRQRSASYSSPFNVKTKVNSLR